MAISEAARSDLYTGLRDVLGPERAETLMNAIPLHDLDEVATKRDVEALRAELVGEVGALRTRSESGLAGLRAELVGGLAGLRAEFKTDLAQMQRSLIGWMVSLFVGTVGAVIGVALLG